MKYISKIDNTTIEVIKFEGNIAYLSNGDFMDKNKLADSTYYQPILNEKVSNSNTNEVMDVNSIMNSTNWYNSVGNKIKNISTDNIVEDRGGVSVSVSYEDEDGSVNYSDLNNLEEERRLLEEKARNWSPPKLAKNPFDNDYDDMVGFTDEEIYGKKGKSSKQTQINKSESNDPIILAFNQAPKTENLTLNLNHSEMIPSKEVIKIFESTFEKPLLDHLSEDIVKNILSNPESLIKTVKNALLDYIYPGKREELEKEEMRLMEEERLKKEEERLRMELLENESEEVEEDLIVEISVEDEIIIERQNDNLKDDE